MYVFLFGSSDTRFLILVVWLFHHNHHHYLHDIHLIDLAGSGPIGALSISPTFCSLEKSSSKRESTQTSTGSGHDRPGKQELRGRLCVGDGYDIGHEPALVLEHVDKEAFPTQATEFFRRKACKPMLYARMPNVRRGADYNSHQTRHP